MAGVFRRGYATPSTRGSLPLDETKPSVPWRAVRSHIVKKAGVLLQGQGARNGDYDRGIIYAILWGGYVSARKSNSFYTRIARNVSSCAFAAVPFVAGVPSYRVRVAHVSTNTNVGWAGYAALERSRFLDGSNRHLS